ncbi:MAG: NUDIX hydrolase [Eubacteriales bacterium]|nr:NUDIX hydrolase [Eubacteriales bacterium]
MLLRNCAGGLVFWQGKIFLIRNEKDEWVFPKGVIQQGDLSHETALNRVKEEADITAEIISTAGHTSYEFFSVTRQKPICNRITWYTMIALDDNFRINEPEKCKEAGYFDIDEAMQLVTHNQDRALLNLTYNKLEKLIKAKAV